MRKRLFLLGPSLFIILSIFSVTHNTSFAENLTTRTINWRTFPLPAYYNGTDEEKGIADKIVDYYIRNLPEYKHNRLTMPIVRTFREMVNATKGGYLCPGKTKLSLELQEQVLTSTIHLVMPPAGIVVRNTDIGKYFSDGKKVSIIHLLNSEERLVMCWIRGVTYHPNIRGAVEDYLRKNEKHPQVYILSQSKYNLYAMLLYNRIDYFADHGIPYQYTCNNYKKYLDNTFFLLVNEAQEDVYTYTFAANTHTGKEIIPKIDIIHNSGEYKAFLRTVIIKHYPPNLVDIYIKKNMAFVGKAMK